MVTIVYDQHSGELVEIKNSITFETDKKTVQELIYHYLNDRLNLNPAFQRESVWVETQRRRLIRSIYENVPIPSIFLYEREKAGSTVYDVIDGKQRIETIFYYLGLKGYRGKKFWFKALCIEDEQNVEYYPYWNELSDKEKNKILSYPIQAITIKGSQSEIADIFVRINSTGSKLKPQEIRKASYYTSEFLKESVKVANRKNFKQYLVKNRILSVEQIKRQKHIELVSELILSIHKGGPINKKYAIDETMRRDTLKSKELKDAVNKFTRTFKILISIFPNLRETRFRGLADLYSLFLLVWKWEYVNKYVLTDKKVKSLVQAYLQSFGNNIDMVREKQRNFQTSKIEVDETIFVDYLRTIVSSTDDINQRKAREKILESVLSSCFIAKDPFRTFNKEQRRIIWYQSSKKCKGKGCYKKLSINNFHIDHIIPYSRGGRTILSNAQILCPECNLKKANKMVA